MEKRTFKTKNAQRNIQRILVALVQPKTYEQLTAELFMSDRTVRSYVAFLREKDGQHVYVKAYLRTKGPGKPIFALGNKRDAPRPKLTSAEKTARWRNKVKQTPELQDRLSRREKVRWLMNKPKQKQTIFTALGI